MKKQTILLVLFLFFSTLAFSQKKGQMPTLSNLISWVNTPRAKFDVAIRAFGFTFEEKDINDNSTNYVYVRKYTKGSIIKTERIIYIVWDSDNSVLIRLVVTDDLTVLYASQRTQLKFTETECAAGEKENETAFCYHSSKYFLRMTDARVEYEAGWGNQYSVLVYKK